MSQVNLGTVLAAAGNAVVALAQGGVPIPPALVSTIEAGALASNALSTLAAQSPANLPAAVSTLVTAAKGLVPTGNPAADKEIEAILGEIGHTAASIANFESGQAAVLGSFSVSIGGVAKKAHVVAVLEGGPAAQSLGL